MPRKPPRTPPRPRPRTRPAPEAGAGPPARVCVGVVGAARGLAGEVRIRSFTAAPEDVAAYGPLTDGNGERTFVLRIVGVHRGQPVARIDGIDDRTAAEALEGQALYVARAALPALDDEEYYHADLVGLRAEWEDGTVFGTVVSVDDHGAGAVIEIDGPAGAVVAPFTRAVVPVVDVAGGRVVVEPVPGLFGPEADEDAEEEGGEGE